MARSSQCSIETKTTFQTRNTHNQDRWQQLEKMDKSIIETYPNAWDFVNSDKQMKSTAGNFRIEYGDLSPSSDLLIQADSFQGSATAGAEGSTGNLVIETLSPTEKVPYVVVRSEIFAIMSSTTAIGADIISSYRLECAMISLNTATLNQLLRTQTA